MHNKSQTVLTEKEALIYQLLALPRLETRNYPACCLDAAERALRLSQEADCQIGIAYSYLALGEHGVFAERFGARYDNGEGPFAHFAKAKEIFARIGCPDGEMLVCLGLGKCYLSHGYITEAGEHFKSAYEIACGEEGEGNPGALNGEVITDSLCGLGEAYAAKGEYDESGRSYARAKEQCAKRRNGYKKAPILYLMGELECARGDNGAARQYYADALDSAVLAGDSQTAADASRALARLCFEDGRYGEYESHMGLASKYYISEFKSAADRDFKSMRSYFVKENARVIANAEQHLKESLFERNRQLEEANWQLNTIYNIGRSITALLDIDEVLKTLYTELSALMNVDGFYIATCEEGGSFLEYKVLYKYGKEITFGAGDSRNVPLGDLAYTCALNDNTLVIDDLGTGAYTADGEAAAQAGSGVISEPGGSAVYTCLRTKGRLSGILCVRSKNAGEYGRHQVKLLDAVSSYVSIALDNAIMYQKLDDVSKAVAGLANHDALTGIPNRRLLMELVPKAYANALRTNTKVAFLFMDLDNFKPINDKYGHTAGDDVLRIFKDRVLGLIRSSDIFARIGGDEFVVVMTDLKINSNAGTLARKIIREIAKPIMIRNEMNYIGVSIGISIFPDDSKDTDVLIVMADEAMYRIKHESKNNLAFYND